MSFRSIENFTNPTSFEPLAATSAPPARPATSPGTFRDHLEKVKTTPSPEARSTQPPARNLTGESASADNQQAVSRDTKDSQSDQNAADGSDRNGTLETATNDVAVDSANPATEDESKDVVELDQEALLKAQELALVAGNIAPQADSPAGNGKEVDPVADAQNNRETSAVQRATLPQMVSPQQLGADEDKETSTQKTPLQQPVTTKQDGDVAVGTAAKATVSGKRESVAKSKEKASAKSVEVAGELNMKPKVPSEEGEAMPVPVPGSQPPDQAEKTHELSRQHGNAESDQLPASDETVPGRVAASPPPRSPSTKDVTRSKARDATSAETETASANPSVDSAASKLAAETTENAETTEKTSRSTRSTQSEGRTVKAVFGQQEDAQATNAGHQTQTTGNLGASSSTTRSEGVVAVDQTRFVHRVARAVRVGHDRGGEVRLRLSPPELGSLRLKIAVKGGVLTAHLETETSAVKTVLLDHLPALRDRLAEQNIKIDQFNVNVRDGSSGGSHGGTAANARQGHNNAGGSFETARVRKTEDVEPEKSRTTSIVGDGQLNVIV